MRAMTLMRGTGGRRLVVVCGEHSFLDPSMINGGDLPTPYSR
jgi:hypothetical protein